MKDEEQEIIEAEAAERTTAREAAADTPPVLASDPRSLTVDRGGAETASTGASEDAAAAAERARRDGA